MTEFDIPPGLPGQVLQAEADGFECGQVGSLTVDIQDGDGNSQIGGPTTAGIIQSACEGNAATYTYNGVYPSDPALSPYVIIWAGLNLDGTPVTASEQFEVTTDAPTLPSNLGPCSHWIDTTDILACCGDLAVGSEDEAALEAARDNAELMLYTISGGRFDGLCGPVTDRPCRDDCACWTGRGVWLRDTTAGVEVIWGGGSWLRGGRPYCGCHCLSEVRLQSYPVLGIAQVKIDGSIVLPSTYRLDRERFLVRTDGDHWPSCQDLSRDDSQTGTFSVSYWYGEAVPQLAKDAAAQLACQFYLACSTEDESDCDLPENATKIIRQGITIERVAILSDALTEGKTGLIHLDAFITAFGDTEPGPMVWSPDRPWPRRIG